MSSPRVLVVDDDLGFLRSCARMLGGWGYVVETACDGPAALGCLGDGVFDVVLSDINVPGLSGIEILRAVRAQNRRLPVVLMTGGPAIDSAREAIELGALHYLIKPFSMTELQAVMARAVEVNATTKRERAILDSSAERSQELVELDARLDRALGGMWMAFQPIVAWSSRTIVAYEALLRSREPTLPTPIHVLRAAETLGQIHKLGRISRRQVADVLAKHADVPGIFVNLHVMDLLDEDLFDPCSPLAGYSPRIHFEITERAALEHIPAVGDRVARLRSLGYRIAIDDLGEGYSGLNSFAQLEPDAVKLDMSLIRGVDGVPMKKKLVRAMASLCRDLNAQLIAEGVETEAERDTLAELGADVMQGYLFARPGPPFPVPSF